MARNIKVVDPKICAICFNIAFDHYRHTTCKANTISFPRWYGRQDKSKEYNRFRWDWVHLVNDLWYPSFVDIKELVRFSRHSS